MSEPRWITLLRHAVLCLFVAIAAWPIHDVASISLRPGNFATGSIISRVVFKTKYPIERTTWTLTTGRSLPVE